MRVSAGSYDAQQGRSRKTRSPETLGLAGVVGMGLMCTSIAACLLGAGHRVACVEVDPEKLRTAPKRLMRILKNAHAKRLFPEAPSILIKLFTVSADFADLAAAQIVIESTVEDIAVKRQVIGQIESAVGRQTLIGTNTSAIPVSDLQRDAQHPERVLGLHWAEPANITRFMEVICGTQTSPRSAARAVEFARRWGKEPSLLRKDIRASLPIGSCTRCFARRSTWWKQGMRRWPMWIALCATTLDIGSPSPAHFGSWI